MIVRRAGLIVGIVAGFLTAAAPALAVAPGANGPIYYQGSLSAGGGPGEIFRINPNGSGRVNLTNTAAKSEERPSVTAAGTRVAFMAFDADSWEISRMDGNGANRVQLTHNGSTIVNFEPGYSPDGTAIAFMRQLPEDAAASYPGSQDLWRIGPTGSGLLDLTNTLYSFTPTHSDECCGEYSPDGTKIVYANGFNSDPLEAESNDIWVMNASGTNQHALTGPHDYPIQDVGPSWSPSGTKIVFSRFGTGNGSDGLYVINANGTGLTPVMNGPAHVQGNNPTWSPDGSKIAFTSGSRIATVPASGGAPVAVTPSTQNADYASWARAAGDTTPPQTTITSGPQGLTRLSTAAFRFTSSQAGSHFACALDGANFAACSSPRSYAGLTQGSHTFRVRSIDPAGNVDPSPAARSFKVDSKPPETTIDSGPSGKIRSKRASFGFSSSEAGSSFRCRLDSAAYAACTTPKAYTGLSRGQHTFSVRATDAAGNVDASPASRSFKVAKRKRKH